MSFDSTLPPTLTTYLAADECSDWSCLPSSTLAATTQLPNMTTDKIGNQLFAGFTSTILVILASELGDKTFFLTTVMAMKHNKQSVFLGAFSATVILIALTIILGLATSFIPKKITHYVAVFLFIVFGIQMIIEALSKSDSEEIKDPLVTEADEEKQTKTHQTIQKIKKLFSRYFSLIFMESFALRFFAEWGDRSQIALILLAAQENIFGMLIGATIGHLICLSLAVIGGSMIARVVSPRSVNMVGGWVFICVAIFTTLKGPDS
ncbi:GDT1-like protein sll0615 [Brevipalpus obovatus]|uniref:GDT1-like protein sll0615 n=1 Tax=Brevipalpus obovatus TaxID=246614 RepID=UPI003D9F9878